MTSPATNLDGESAANEGSANNNKHGDSIANLELNMEIDEKDSIDERDNSDEENGSVDQNQDSAATI
jgi:hypothetical protein